MAKNTGKVREFCQSGKVGTLSKKKITELMSLNNVCYFRLVSFNFAHFYFA